MHARRDGADTPLGIGCHAGRAEMGAHRNAKARQGGLAVAVLGMGDLARDQILAGIVVGEQRLGLVAAFVERVDRDALLLAELFVEIAPVGGEVGAVPEPRDHREIAHFEHIAGLGAFDVDRTSHDMHAGISVVFRDVAIKLPDGVVHQQVGCIPGVMGDGLDMDVVAALDLERRRKSRIEIAQWQVSLVALSTWSMSAASRSNMLKPGGSTVA
jgi:hypothetical protein